jgi:hypothetical protein
MAKEAMSRAEFTNSPWTGHAAAAQGFNIHILVRVCTIAGIVDAVPTGQLCEPDDATVPAKRDQQVPF